MIPDNLNAITKALKKAKCPEDIFGFAKTKEQLKVGFHNLAYHLHPDRYNNDKVAESIAKSLFIEVKEIYDEALKRIDNKTYGKQIPLAGKTPIIIKSKYIIEKSLCAGDMCDLHVVSMESSAKRQNLLLKIAHNADDNDLLRAEQDTLSALHKRLKTHLWKDAIPNIIDGFLLEEGKQRLRTNVITYFENFLNAEEIYERTKGVDGQTIGWMWKRLLVLLEWTTREHLHGAILPPHVMFYPDNASSGMDDRKHSIRLVDWCYSIEWKHRTKLSAWIPKWEHFYAPEVLAKKELGPWTDLYMGAKVMLYLLGGNVKKDIFPASLPKKLSQTIVHCLEHEPANRPQSIGKYFEHFKKVLTDVYGAPKWHDFVLPGI